MNPPRLHALYVVLGEEDFLVPSLASVYDAVDAITVVTTMDRDWHGRPRTDGRAAVDLLLSRVADPEHKIDVLVMDETSEARARNRAMAAVIEGTRPVRRQHAADLQRPPVDWFLIVDADEIWTAGDLERLRTYASDHPRAPIMRAGAVRYFRTWNHRIAGLEWSTVLVRAGHRFNDLRNHRMPLACRVLARVPGMPELAAARLRGFHDIPADVAVFHHGSYVGPRARIESKLASFGHHHELRPDWLRSVYDRFDVDARDFHPVDGPSFASVEHVSTDDLPVEIGGATWPGPDYIETRGT